LTQVNPSAQGEEERADRCRHAQGLARHGACRAPGEQALPHDRL